MEKKKFRINIGGPVEKGGIKKLKYGGAGYIYIYGCGYTFPSSPVGLYVVFENYFCDA